MEWTKKTVAGAVDLALLKPGMTQEELRAGLKAAIRLGCASACVRGCDIREAEAILRGTQTMLSAVVAFPHGGASTEAKAFEAAHYAKAGAREIDFVIAVGMAASGDYAYVAHDMESVAFAAHAEGSIVKAIFECCLLSESAIQRLCEIASGAGCDFVKTSTGFSFGGARAADVALMKRSVKPGVRVKASGGIRTPEDALAMLRAGADRLGVSAPEAIIAAFPD